MSVSFLYAARTMGAPIAVFLLKHFLGEGSAAVGDGAIEIISKKIEDEENQRDAQREFDKLADKIVKKLLPLFSDLDDKAALPIIVELGSTLSSNISAEFFLDRDLDPESIAQALRNARKLPFAMFSAAEESLYYRALDEAVRYIVETAQSLPKFEATATATVLSRISRMGTDIDKILDTVSKIEQRFGSSQDREQSKINRFEADYCQAVTRNLDYLELFGADISPESQRNSLTVGYVSLNLSEFQHHEKSTILNAQDIFTFLGAKNGRLVIRGHAGSGKSTLLRWVAIQCAKGIQGEKSGSFEIFRAYNSLYNSLYRRSQDLDGLTETFFIKFKENFKLLNIPSNSSSSSSSKYVNYTSSLLSKLDEKMKINSLMFLNKNSADISKKIPFLIRLRDCVGGKLPSPSDFPGLVASEIDRSPEGWVLEVLNMGNALILFDGVDEVPNIRRHTLGRDIEAIVKQYPKCWFIVTSRPSAIPSNWLAECGFFDTSVSPLNEIERADFIVKWHEAVSNELMKQGRPMNLQDLAGELITKLSENAAIARLASNPLLCAVICALHRDRNRKLPESQAELCEAMCHLLLHRREVEAGVTMYEFPEEYRKLSYEQKRAIVQEIAYNMVRNEISSLDDSYAVDITRNVLRLFPAARDFDARVVLRTLIERSGILREQRPGFIDFVHNTLKEFLAAESFAMNRDIPTMIRHAAEESWRQIVLFASASRDKELATKLVSGILDLADTLADQTASRHLKLIAVDCRSASLHLDPTLVTRLSSIERTLVPPKNMTDAEALASSGDNVVPLLRHKRMKAREAAASVRTLRLIGTPLSRKCLESYFKDARQEVIFELCLAVNPLSIESIQEKVRNGNRLPSQIMRQINSLDPISDPSNFKSLHLFEAGNISFRNLKRFINLEILDVAFSGVSSLAGMEGLPLLKTVDASYSELRELGSLENLPNLRMINLNGTQIEDFDRLAKLNNLEVLELSATSITNLGPIAELHNLNRLDVTSCEKLRVLNFNPLTSITELAINSSAANCYTVASAFPKLRSLHILSGLTDSASALAQLHQLERLAISVESGLNLHSTSKFPSVRKLTLYEFPSSFTPEDLKIFPNLEDLTLNVFEQFDFALLVSGAAIRTLHLLSNSNLSLAGLEILDHLQTLDLGGADKVQLCSISRLTRISSLVVPRLTIADAEHLREVKSLDFIYWLECPPPGVNDILGGKLRYVAEYWQSNARRNS